MSKTEGRRVDPVEAAKRYGPDALRYYLLREIAFDRDGDFSWENFETRYNSDLANDLGNLVSRVLSMINRYCKGTIPQPEGVPDRELAEAAGRLAAEIPAMIQDLELCGVLGAIWGVIGLANRKVEEAAPWNLAKDPAQGSRLRRCLYDLAETVRILALVIGPYMPCTSKKIFDQLGMADEPLRFDRDMVWGRLKPGQALGTLSVLFHKDAVARA